MTQDRQTLNPRKTKPSTVAIDRPTKGDPSGGRTLTRPGLLQRLPRNPHGRDLLVGDLHGCVSLLESELARVGFNADQDRVIAVGDLVDRGPESDDVGYLLLQPWFHSVLGNHDLSFAARKVDPGSWAHWEIPGCHPWATSLEEDHCDHLRELIARLPWAMEIETEAGLVGIVHAELPRPYTDWGQFTADLDAGPNGLALREQAVGNRYLHRLATSGAIGDASTYEVTGVAHVVHGHSSSDDCRIHRLANRYWIDCRSWEAASPSRYAIASMGSPRLAIVDARDPGKPL